MEKQIKLKLPFSTAFYIDDDRVSEGSFIINEIEIDSDEYNKLHETFNFEDTPIGELDILFGSLYKDLYINVMPSILSIVKEPGFDYKCEEYVNLNKLNRDLHKMTYNEAIELFKKCNVEIPESCIDLKKREIKYTTVEINSTQEEKEKGFDTDNIKPYGSNPSPFAKDIWNFLYKIENDVE